jgi:hypothetical protein
LKKKLFLTPKIKINHMAPIKKDSAYKFNSPKLAEQSGLQIKPVRIGAIPKLAVLLGLLSPQFFEIYNACNGEKDIATLASELNIDSAQMRIDIDKLAKSKMISI